MISPDTHRQVVLVSRPGGIPQAENFAIVQAEVRPPGPAKSWCAMHSCRSTPRCAAG